MDAFTRTALVEVIFHVLVVLFAYHLCQVDGQTQAGERFAGKTKRARQREVRRERTVWMVGIAGPYYAVLDQLDVSEVMLEIEGGAKERLRGVIQRMKAVRDARKQALGLGGSAPEAAYEAES